MEEEWNRGNGKNHDVKRSGRGKKIRDITGQRFGRLTALYVTEKRDGKGSAYWHCRCQCGNEIDVTESSLMYGNYQSCGCRKREVQKAIPSKLHRVDHTCLEWLEKRKSRKDNTSGFRGVSRTKSGRYRASIGFKNQRFHLGTYEQFEDAVKARLAAEEVIHDGFVKAYHRWEKERSQEPFVFEVTKEEGGFRIDCNI